MARWWEYIAIAVGTALIVVPVTIVIVIETQHPPSADIANTTAATAPRPVVVGPETRVGGVAAGVEAPGTDVRPVQHLHQYEYSK